MDKQFQFIKSLEDQGWFLVELNVVDDGENVSAIMTNGELMVMIAVSFDKKIDGLYDDRFISKLYYQWRMAHGQ